MPAQATTARRAATMTPIGELLLVAQGGALCEIRLPDPSIDLPGMAKGGSPAALLAAAPPAPAPSRPAVGAAAAADPVLDEARRQLDEYFAGQRREFDLPLRIEGTQFQRRVWEALRAVGYGETVTYAQLAHTIGRPGAARAVGAAMASNPLPLVLPCHRVVGARGDLVGFGGGIARKRYLLETEAAYLLETETAHARA